MRSARLVCLFAILISVLALAQSRNDQLANQRNGNTFTKQRSTVLPLSLSEMPQGATFGRPPNTKFKGTAARRGVSVPGLGFAPAVDFDSGGQDATSAAVADVNGDGKPDLLVANYSGGVGVLLGNGDGTFQPAVVYGTAGAPSSLAVADVNGDGKPDLLVTDATGGNGIVGVLLGNGDGTFQGAVFYDSGGFDSQSVAVADVNGDGKLDLLVANTCEDSECRYGSAVGVLLGNGDGTFQTAVSYYSLGDDAMSVAVADVNGDGKLDLLVANANSNENGSAGVLLGNGDGTFQRAVAYNSGGIETFSVAVADVNGDGKPDLLVANANNYGAGTVCVLLGNGDGTFQTAVSYQSGGGVAFSIAVADFNGDGKPDLLAANYCVTEFDCVNGGVGVLLGNGDGTFQTAATYSSGGYRTNSAIEADVNGDGKPDLLVANFCATHIISNCNDGTVGVLLNTSLGPTTTTLTSSPNPSNFGQPVTLTATVAGQGFKGPPTGTVSFFDGTTNIGNTSLNSSGVATLTTSALTVGTHSMTVTYNGDSNFAPSTSPVLYQVVNGAIVALSPASLNFGNQTVGITSTPQIVTLTNTGNISLTLSSIQITGTNSGDFAQSNNCPSSVAPNNGCQISVTFTPTAIRTRNAAVSITDNAPGSPQMVLLTGVGVLPAVTFSPTSLMFPTQVIFTSSATEPVTLSNSGLGVLLINNIAVTSPFQQTNDCPASIGPGANCTISVKFHPGNKGVFHGAVSVTDNAPGSPQKVPLTGIGTFVQLTPAKLNFGTQPVGTRSLPKKITLTNKGDSSVKITDIVITGADAGDFAETNTCGKTVASGASCFIKVTFKPLAKGKRTADVSVYDNGGGSPQGVELIGAGT